MSEFSSMYQLLLVAAVLLTGPPTSAAQCTVPELDLTEYRCTHLTNVCLDQGTFILHDYNPATAKKPMPKISAKLEYNWPNKYGNGDMFKEGKLYYPEPVLRPASTQEPSEELANPVFDNCTAALVFWVRYLYNPAESYLNGYTHLYMLQQRFQAFDRRVTLVPVTPAGQALPEYSRLWYQSLSDVQVSSLAEISARGNQSQPRCFSRMALCAMSKHALEGKPWEAGHHLIRTYAIGNHTDSHSPSNDSAATLRVVFAVRDVDSEEHMVRSILNMDDLVARCNSWIPSKGSKWQKALCVPHRFGNRGVVADMRLMSEADVLVYVHGAAYVNGWYMKKYTSLIEIRPYEFPQKWANRYAATSVNYECKQFFWAIDIHKKSNSKPGWREKERRWGYQRDRITILPWKALKYHLKQIVDADADPFRYQERYMNGSWYINESLMPLHYESLRQSSEGWHVFHRVRLPTGQEIDVCSSNVTASSVAAGDDGISAGAQVA